MDWQSHYRAHLTTAAEAVQRIKSGDRVVIGHACAEPSALVDAMVANAAAYRDVEIVHLLPMGPAHYLDPGMEAHFRHNSMFLGGPSRKAYGEGRADLTPAFFSRVPDLIRTRFVPSVALIHVSPPDQHGYCSLGLAVDYAKAAAETAGLVLAQVNPQMPRLLGDSFVHVSRFDAIVEVDAPVIELPSPDVGAVETAIGRHCASLIKDGDTLQFGIGAIPSAVVQELAGFKDLGIHSEMFSDGVVDLIERGVITNARKTLHPGQCVCTFLMGTRQLYDYVDNNPAVFGGPVDYVNNVMTIARNDNMVAINSCVQVDLQGQVVASTAGLRQISAIGGQADFVRGAALSQGGRSILAFPSTAKGGTVSRIVPVIDTGSVVSTGREDVQFLVTEYGVADMSGQSLRQRAERLIAIAHPAFRDQLSAEFARRRA